MASSLQSRFSSLLRFFRPITLVWIFPILLIVPNTLLFFTEPTTVMSRLTDIVLPLGLYFWVMSLSVNVGRTTLLIFIFALLAAFQIVLLYLYGESIIAIDMYTNLVTSNPGEAKELLGNLMFAIFIIIIIYFPPLLWAIILLIKRKRAQSKQLRLPRKVGLVISSAGLLLLLATYISVPTYSIQRELFPANVLHNMYTACVRIIDTQKYSTTSASFSYDASSTRDKELKEIYVLIIGETSRADNWQLLGYERPTNPALSKRVDNLLSFPKTLTESNTTHKSVPLMLSHLTADTYGDSIYYTKSLISAFNQAGFNTAFFSNQRRNHSFIDFFAGQAQQLEFIQDDFNGQQPPYDTKLVDYLEKFIDNSSNHKIFVILHCYGSHFNYKERYPAGYGNFKPDNSSQAKIENRAQLLNAYDNSIQITDEMVDDVIKVLEKQGGISAMIFVSDHGEDIFDDERKRFLHSSPIPTFHQLHVPLLIWMSEEYKDTYPDIYNAGKTNVDKDVTSTRSIFHTLLDMSGISSPYYSPEASLTDSSYKMIQRKYLNDYNEGVDYDHAGFRKPDFVKLDSAKIGHWKQ